VRPTKKDGVHVSKFPQHPHKFQDRKHDIHRTSNDAQLFKTAKRSRHATPLLQPLQRLPVVKRIEQKVLTITFKARNGLAPSYLSELLIDIAPARESRSSDSPRLAVPYFKLKTWATGPFAQ